MILNKTQVYPYPIYTFFRFSEKCNFYISKFNFQTFKYVHGHILSCKKAQNVYFQVDVLVRCQAVQLLVTHVTTAYPYPTEKQNVSNQFIIFVVKTKQKGRFQNFYIIKIEPFNSCIGLQASFLAFHRYQFDKNRLRNYCLFV